MFYAGIGARSTPLPTLDLMTRIAHRLEVRGYQLRSGGAKGADTAFERGTRWPCIYTSGDRFTQHHIDIARTHHPAWDRLSGYVQGLMVRNVAIILGANYDTGFTCPSKFVVCWTPNSAVTGGTGHSLRVADTFNIPIYNLATPHILNELGEFLNP